ncbi:hypothetical protein [Dendrosporobacter sp. 1207_IL3150]|uniref:hypothetical protein n=1 Tax=Dendrosporobacter sp. 1207_IL3150 TaxID=3084054 RepID=UPI002FDA41CF
MSKFMKKSILLNFTIILISLLLCGCGMLETAKKPEIGPAGKPTESKPNPPFMQRFVSPPAQLYDLEATSGVIFEGLNKAKWDQAQAGFNNLQSTWEQVKPLVGEKKGVKEADEALGKLAASITDKKITNSYENLNKFMGSIGDVAKSYKLSPLSDIIAVGNSIRNVSFYVEDKEWSKAASKVKELEGTWNKVKPSMEQIGILDQITITHSNVNQIKDAVNAENKGAVDENIANLNESLGKIREFFYGR